MTSYKIIIILSTSHILYVYRLTYSLAIFVNNESGFLHIVQYIMFVANSLESFQSNVYINAFMRLY